MRAIAALQGQEDVQAQEEEKGLVEFCYCCCLRFSY